MTEYQLKKRFAEEWLFDPDNAFAAALKLTKGNVQQALEIASSWIYDDEVAQAKEELLAEKGEEYFLPSKTSMVWSVLRRSQEANDDDFCKLMKLAADMRGFIEKPGVTINNSITTNKVMNIPVFVGSDGNTIDAAQWEQRLIEQQKSLTER